MLNIFVTNLGKYNEGKLVGEWVKLPVSGEELEAVFERIGINEEYEEIFITDCETDIPNYKVDEFDSIDELNELADTLENMDDYDREIVEALLSDGYDLEKALDKKDDCMVYWDCNDMTDVAMRYADETGLLDSIPENLRYYFDYEALGRDMKIEGCYIFTSNGNCIEVI